MSDMKSGVEVEPQRRRFITWLSGAFLSLWGIGLLGVVGSFLKLPRSRGSLAERQLKIGAVDSIPVGGAQLVRHGKEPIYVVRVSEESYVGLSAVCTHLHCVLNWDRGRGVLDCPCHNGAFDTNGNVLQGPPPQALRRYRVDAQLGQLYVHL